MEDIPNGFLYHPKKADGFESAGDAIRRRASEVAGRNPSINLAAARAQKQALYDGWRVDPVETVNSRDLREHSRWGAGGVFRGQDMVNFLRVPDVANGEEGPCFDINELERIKELDRRWSWVEVNLSAIQNNIMAIKGILAPDCMFMAVVKGDGYGHGAIKIARTALNCGASYLGVATVDEAIELRKAEIDAPILILSEPPIASIPLLLAYRIMPSVSTAEFAIKYAEAADSIGMRARYHLKVNTGMNRIGVRADEVLSFLQMISFHRALELIGTFTHFATADSPDTMEFYRQKHRFDEVLAQMRGAGFDPGIVHAANSSATLRYPEVHYDMVRPGIAMYGSYPCPETYGRVRLLPAMSVKARITQVNQVPMGEGVSYGLIYRSNGFAKTCTVPIGYGDGLKRSLSGRINFIMDGQLHPQVGSICMDQCMFEVDQRTRAVGGRIEPEVGDEVVIIGQQGNSFIMVEDMAEVLDMIPYEVMISFGSSRLTRVYV